MGIFNNIQRHLTGSVIQNYDTEVIKQLQEKIKRLEENSIFYLECYYGPQLGAFDNTFYLDNKLNSPVTFPKDTFISKIVYRYPFLKTMSKGKLKFTYEDSTTYEYKFDERTKSDGLNFVIDVNLNFSKINKIQLISDSGGYPNLSSKQIVIYYNSVTN